VGRSERGFDLEHTAGLLEEGAVVCQETDLLWLLLLIEALIGGAVVVVVLFLLLAPIQSVGIRLLLSARLGVQVLYPQEFPCREKHTHTHISRCLKTAAANTVANLLSGLDINGFPLARGN
jgi:hypothetical protein